jgi:LysM repeat protein
MLTVKGTNFGASMAAEGLQGQMGDPATTLPCGTVTWTTNNIAVCHAAHGNAKSATLAIGPAPSGESETTTNSNVPFSFDAPVVTFLALNNGPTVGGSLLTITGMNLGTTQAISNDVAISVNNNKCASSAFISSSAVTCVTPAGFGQALNVQVRINSVEGELFGLYEYDARFISPPAAVQYTTLVGENLEISIMAKGEDFDSEIALKSITPLANSKVVSQVQTFAGGEHQLTKMSEGTKDPSASFTWSPRETGQWEACFGLYNSALTEVDTRCVTIRVIQCQHMVVPGDTQESIAEKYQLEWQAIFLLNGEMKDKTDVSPGQLLNIGKVITMEPGETISSIDELYFCNGGLYHIALGNPGLIIQNAAGQTQTNPAAVTQLSSYLTSPEYVGRQICILPNSKACPPEEEVQFNY